MILRQFIVIVILFLSTTHFSCGPQTRLSTRSSSAEYDPASTPDAGCEGPCTITTPQGTTYRVPKRFRAERRGAVVQLLGPDKRLLIHSVELTGSSCVQAVKEAWRRIAPQDHWPRISAETDGPEQGFDESCSELYRSKSGKEQALALARRKDKRIWVAIVRGPVVSVDRDMDALKTFVGGMTAPGVEIREKREYDQNLKDDKDLSKKPLSSIQKSEEPFRKFIDDTMKATGVPGLAIAVIEDGRVVFAQGFGVRELGKAAPITPDTLMMIGSVTTALTTFLMGTLVDEGKLAWDRPVREVWPAFALGDAKLAATLTMEQMMCACAGLPEKELALVLGKQEKTADDCLKELAGLSPITALYETFLVQRHLVTAGGYFTAHLLHPKLPLEKAYTRAMQERVFDALGMKSTLLDLDSARKAPNHASPHSYGLDMVHQVLNLEHERFTANFRPSIGGWSNVTDLARLVVTELNGGVTPEGKRVISEKNLRHRRTPQVKTNNNEEYGLGLFITRTWGLENITLGGGTLGFSTLVSFFPRKKAGVVILVNGRGQKTVKAIQTRLFELWFSADLKSAAVLEEAVIERKRIEEFAQTQLSHPTAEFMTPYLGRFFHPELGEAVIAKVKDDYILTIGPHTSRLMLFRLKDGRKAFILTGMPLTGKTLTPVFGTPGALELMQGRESYVLSPKK